MSTWWSEQRRWAAQHLGGQTKMVRVAAYGLRTPKNTKKTRKKHIEREGEIRKGERVRRERRREQLPPLFRWLLKLHLN